MGPLTGLILTLTIGMALADWLRLTDAAARYAALIILITRCALLTATVSCAPILTLTCALMVMVAVAMAMRVTPQLATRVTPQQWRIAACRLRLTFGVGCHLVRGYHLSASHRLWHGHGGGPGLVTCMFLAALVHASGQARGRVGAGGAYDDGRWWGWLARLFGDAEVR